ncbi:MAG: hypothetical protein WCK26_02705 [Candidatus Saccharibacteria bacterium]
MKDFDFDEIDRAVNSTITSSSTVGDDDNNQSIPSPEKTAPLAGRRSSGQFMDVVHPSSDMRRSPLMMPNRVPGQGVVTDNSKDSSDNLPKPNEPQTDIPKDIKQPENEWPDPIDFHKSKENSPEDFEDTGHDEKNNQNGDINLDGLKSQNDAKTDIQDEISPKDENEDADIDKISDDLTNEMNHISEESSDSPFISGTKVDKRPLGAFSDESVDKTEEEPVNVESPVVSHEIEAKSESKPETESESEIKSEPETETDTSASTVIPAELQNDLLSIESDNSTNSTVPVDSGSGEANNGVSKSEPQSVGPTSIVQQYKEQPSTGDKKTGAIYDTDAYHKALVKPVKKKPSWLWALWIAILVVVGAGSGAAIYYFLLPLL